jgi:hypothetical protein
VDDSRPAREVAGVDLPIHRLFKVPAGYSDFKEAVQVEGCSAACIGKNTDGTLHT